MTTALIIEDNELERDFIISYMDRCGIDGYESHGTLAGGVHAMTESEYGLIVLDLQLEDSRAEDTIRRLPEISFLAKGAPIIICTGNPSAIMDGAMIYAQGLVRKPFNADEFIDIAKTAIHSTRLRNPVKKKQSPLCPTTA
jgi:DNA-binding response OmpR family regulator